MSAEYEDVFDEEIPPVAHPITLSTSESFALDDDDDDEFNHDPTPPPKTSFVPTTTSSNHGDGHPNELPPQRKHTSPYDPRRNSRTDSDFSGPNDDSHSQKATQPQQSGPVPKASSVTTRSEETVSSGFHLDDDEDDGNTKKSSTSQQPTTTTTSATGRRRSSAAQDLPSQSTFTVDDDELANVPPMSTQSFTLDFDGNFSQTYRYENLQTMITDAASLRVDDALTTLQRFNIVRTGKNRLILLAELGIELDENTTLLSDALPVLASVIKDNFQEEDGQVGEMALQCLNRWFSEDAVKAFTSIGMMTILEHVQLSPSSMYILLNIFGKLSNNKSWLRDNSNALPQILMKMLPQPLVHDPTQLAHNIILSIVEQTDSPTLADKTVRVILEMCMNSAKHVSVSVDMWECVPTILTTLEKLTVMYPQSDIMLTELNGWDVLVKLVLFGRLPKVVERSAKLLSRSTILQEIAKYVDALLDACLSKPFLERIPYLEILAKLLREKHLTPATHYKPVAECFYSSLQSIPNLQDVTGGEGNVFKVIDMTSDAMKITQRPPTSLQCVHKLLVTCNSQTMTFKLCGFLQQVTDLTQGQWIVEENTVKTVCRLFELYPSHVTPIIRSCFTSYAQSQVGRNRVVSENGFATMMALLRSSESTNVGFMEAMLEVYRSDPRSAGGQDFCAEIANYFTLMESDGVSKAQHEKENLHCLRILKMLCEIDTANAQICFVKEIHSTLLNRLSTMGTDQERELSLILLGILLSLGHHSTTNAEKVLNGVIASHQKNERIRALAAFALAASLYSASPKDVAVQALRTIPYVQQALKSALDSPLLVDEQKSKINTLLGKLVDPVQKQAADTAPVSKSLDLSSFSSSVSSSMDFSATRALMDEERDQRLMVVISSVYEWIHELTKRNLHFTTEMQSRYHRMVRKEKEVMQEQMEVRALKHTLIENDRIMNALHGDGNDISLVQDRALVKSKTEREVESLREENAFLHGQIKLQTESHRTRQLLTDNNNMKAKILELEAQVRHMEVERKEWFDENKDVLAKIQFQETIIHELRQEVLQQDSIMKGSIARGHRLALHVSTVDEECKVLKYKLSEMQSRCVRLEALVEDVSRIPDFRSQSKWTEGAHVYALEERLKVLSTDYNSNKALLSQKEAQLVEAQKKLAEKDKELFLLRHQLHDEQEGLEWHRSKAAGVERETTRVTKRHQYEMMKLQRQIDVEKETLELERSARQGILQSLTRERQIIMDEERRLNLIMKESEKAVRLAEQRAEDDKDRTRLAQEHVANLMAKINDLSRELMCVKEENGSPRRRNKSQSDVEEDSERKPIMTSHKTKILNTIPAVIQQAADERMNATKKKMNLKCQCVCHSSSLMRSTRFYCRCTCSKKKLAQEMIRSQSAQNVTM